MGGSWLPHHHLRMGERDVAALLRLGGVLSVVAVVRLAALIARGAAPPLAPVPDRVDTLLALTEAAVAESDRRTRPLEQGERIPVNRADEVELDRLPRVGPSLARAILEERTRGGRFRGPHDLTRVKGVGEATATRLGPYLEFSGGTPSNGGVSTAPASSERVSLSRASEGELRTLPGIGPALASRIVAHRRTRPFLSVEDLLAVPGIGPATLARIRDRVRVP